MVAILPLEPIAAIVAANRVRRKVKNGEVLRSVATGRAESQVGSETGKDGGRRSRRSSGESGMKAMPIVEGVGWSVVRGAGSVEREAGSGERGAGSVKRGA